MPAAENLTRVAAEWVQKAENDLRAAAHTLKLGRKCPTDTVCFHAQQCAEKLTSASGGVQCLLPGEDRPCR